MRWTESGTIYVVDASSWIDFHEVNHPPDIFPTLWDLLAEHVEAGRIKTARQVITEVGEHDGVGKWLRTKKETVTLRTNVTINARVGVLLATYPNMTHGADESADPWLIALAEHHGYVLVTNEKRSNSPTKPRIPNICDDLNVDQIDGIAMLRALQICI